MSLLISKPLNRIQRDWNALVHDASAENRKIGRSELHRLLITKSRPHTDFAINEMQSQLGELHKYNPWHVLYALGLAWGHFASLDIGFTSEAVEAIATGSPTATAAACKYHLERGPDGIERSLRGARQLFALVPPPATIPDNIRSLARLQQRFYGPSLRAETRPYGVGGWNATALILMALFARPDLADQLKSSDILMPPSGTISAALALLHRASLVSQRPLETLSEDAFDAAATAANTVLMVEVVSGLTSGSIVEVHNGLWLLGTRFRGDFGVLA